MQYGYRIVEDMASGLQPITSGRSGFAFITGDDRTGVNGNIIPAEDLVDRSYIAHPRLIRSKMRRLRTLLYLPATTHSHQRWSGDEHCTARRIAIRKMRSAVCCAVIMAFARSPVLI